MLWGEFKLVSHGEKHEPIAAVADDASSRLAVRRRSLLKMSALSAGAAAVGVGVLFAPTAAHAMSLRYQYPFPIEWYDASDPFGNISPPWRSPTSPHRGADFNGRAAGVAGTPIPAVADGVVVYNGWFDGLGHMVSLRHPDGYYSGYCHMVAPSMLRNGDAVRRDGIVGGVGGTATASMSYSPHLHLTMAADVVGTRGGASRFDPIPFIGARLNVAPSAADEEDEEMAAKIYINSATGEVRAISEATGLDFHIPNEVYLERVLVWKVFVKGDPYSLPADVFNTKRAIAAATRLAIKNAQ